MAIAAIVYVSFPMKGARICKLTTINSYIGVMYFSARLIHENRKRPQSRGSA